MDTKPQVDLPTPESVDSALSRRGFLRGAALAGGGLVAVSLAACAPSGAPAWTFGPTLPAPTPGASGVAVASAGASASAAASAAPSHDMSASPTPAASGSAAPSGPVPAGWTEHDVAARDVIRRYLGNLVPALKDIYRSGRVRQDGHDPGRRGRLSPAHPEARLRAGPATCS